MRSLLDTHVFLWWLLDDPRLSVAQRPLLSAREATFLLSSVTGLEVATKFRVGKLPGVEGLLDRWDATLERLGVEEIDLTGDLARRAGRMPGAHRDPFDRIIAATALSLDIPVLSADLQLDVFAERRIA